MSGQASHAGAIGIMDGAYFVSKKDLLIWLNNLLGLNYSKIEDVCNGAAFCQIMDAIFPGKVPLHKVNFGAKLQHEMIANYKILQNVFDRCGVGKIVDVDKLIQGKVLDNLEFFQWIKRYFDLNFPAGSSYNGPERRKSALDSTVMGSIPKPNQPFGHGQQLAPISSSTSVSTESTASTETTAPSSQQPKKQLPPMKQRTDKKHASAGSIPSQQHQQKTASSLSLTEQSVQETNQQQAADIVELPVAEFANLKYTVDTLQRERDFYFLKLREIEDLCVASKNDPQITAIASKLLAILYKKDEQQPSNPQ